MENIRRKEFQRNEKLEEFLKEINFDLEIAEKELLKKEYEDYPVVLVMGALRSGTTLLTQWLANTNEFAYPTNVLSRFYQAPIIGAKIQRLLFDREYNFRNEIRDFNQEINYSSENGKTRGALAPNEFWYFWRRFFQYEELSIDFRPDEELEKSFDRETFYRELMGIADVFHKPIALKGMIANYNIGFLNQILKKAVFIFIQREPESNIASILEARKRQLGDITKWYSFRIPEMPELLKLEDPVMQAAGQRYYINRAVGNSLLNVSEERKLEIKYEDFCRNPEAVYQMLRDKLKKQGCDISETYQGQKSFTITRDKVAPEIKEGYRKFMDGI